VEYVLQLPVPDKNFAISEVRQTLPRYVSLAYKQWHGHLTQQAFWDRIVVSILACHAGSRGSIPRPRDFLPFLLWAVLFVAVCDNMRVPHSPISTLHFKDFHYCVASTVRDVNSDGNGSVPSHVDALLACLSVCPILSSDAAVCACSVEGGVVAYIVTCVVFESDYRACKKFLRKLVSWIRVRGT
jgi:hypothetical protein